MRSWRWLRPKRTETDVPAAKEALRRARADWAHVRRVTGKAAYLRRENGFGRDLERAMGGSKP